MDARLNYVVTDNSGNVVAVVPGSQVMTNGGNITGNFLTPGNTYNIATALASAPVSVGNPIPAGVAGVSPTSQGTIPVAPTPQVTEDSANPGRASITVSPTAPNTEYALVDDNGNTVYPFTTPTNNSHGVGTVTFGNLDPGRTYHVVPRQTGSNDTPAQRQAAGADLPVSTNNLGLTVNTFDVTVIANNAALPANFKINGQAETDINKLRNLAPGTTVEILAQPLDNASNTFSNWEVVSGLPSSSATTNARITFTMPNRPVKVQAMYSDGTSWDGNVYNDNINIQMMIQDMYYSYDFCDDFSDIFNIVKDNFSYLEMSYTFNLSDYDFPVLSIDDMTNLADKTAYLCYSYESYFYLKNLFQDEELCFYQDNQIIEAKNTVLLFPLLDKTELATFDNLVLCDNIKKIEKSIFSSNIKKYSVDFKKFNVKFNGYNIRENMVILYNFYRKYQNIDIQIEEILDCLSIDQLLFFIINTLLVKLNLIDISYDFQYNKIHTQINRNTSKQNLNENIIYQKLEEYFGLFN